ncbi:MAG: Na(+)/H(+) antiporter subunit B [Xanthomonadales bacterium]|nr:Na(+)/H(+) antiporter subunit B [Xanthomonadales bacterium]
MPNHVILRVVAKVLIPVIVLFALYVQFHGELGPGGGFQAGVILASAFILHLLIFGQRETRKIVSLRLLRILGACGVLIYAGVGIASLLLGGKFLDYNVLAHDPVHGQHLGITLIEIGVALTVSSTMVALIYIFVERLRAAEE